MAKNTNATEHEEQSIFIAWAGLQENVYPGLELIHAIPNERIGARQGAKFKREGVKAGVPDLCLPVPRGGYHGLYLETKRKGGDKPRPNQRWWIKNLIAQGYAVNVCYGFDELKESVIRYLELTE